MSPVSIGFELAQRMLPHHQPEADLIDEAAQAAHNRETHRTSLKLAALLTGVAVGTGFVGYKAVESLEHGFEHTVGAIGHDIEHFFDGATKTSIAQQEQTVITVIKSDASINGLEVDGRTTAKVKEHTLLPVDDGTSVASLKLGEQSTLNPDRKTNSAIAWSFAGSTESTMQLIATVNVADLDNKPLVPGLVPQASDQFLRKINPFASNGDNNRNQAAQSAALYDFEVCAATTANTEVPVSTALSSEAPSAKETILAKETDIAIDELYEPLLKGMAEADPKSEFLQSIASRGISIRYIETAPRIPGVAANILNGQTVTLTKDLVTMPMPAPLNLAKRFHTTNVTANNQDPCVATTAISIQLATQN